MSIRPFSALFLLWRRDPVLALRLDRIRQGLRPGGAS